MKATTMTLKLDRKQMTELERVSEATRISKSELVRQGIEMAVRKYTDGSITREFRRQVDQNLRADRKLLGRLKDA